MGRNLFLEMQISRNAVLAFQEMHLEMQSSKISTLKPMHLINVGEAPAKGAGIHQGYLPPPKFIYLF